MKQIASAGRSQGQVDIFSQFILTQLENKYAREHVRSEASGQIHTRCNVYMRVI